MNDYLKQALEIAKAQASVRPMTEEQIGAFVANLTKSIEETANGLSPDEEGGSNFVCDPKHSIRDKSVTCVICGQKFRIITSRHLAQHGMNAKQYRELCGFKPKTSLACKELVRSRAATMDRTKIWERKGEKESAE